MTCDILDFVLIDPFELGETWAVDTHYRIPCVAITVNGIDLVQIVECLEDPTNPPTGIFELNNYGHIDPKTLLETLKKPERILLARCGGCGETECCSLDARLIESDDRITWQIYGTQLQVTDGLTFTFEKHQYQKAIAKLQSMMLAN